MQTSSTESFYITFFKWVAVPTASGRENETIVECDSFLDALQVVAGDDENMGYRVALRVRRIDRDFYYEGLTPELLARLADECGPKVYAEGFAYVTDECNLPDRTEIVWPTRDLTLDVPKRFHREIKTRGRTMA